MKTKVIHAFLWILVCMVLGITCYQCRDLRGYVILSGSMEPVIPTGSVAVVDSSKRDVRPGNIATFERHGDLVTHRILSKTEEGYQTKGDANTDPIFTSLTAANIVEGQLDGKDLNVPVHYYAIQELNTGEGTTIPQKAASAWKKYELQNQGQAGQITTPQSDESGNNGVTTVDGNGNAASDENKTNTPDDVQVEPEQDGNNTLS